MLDFETLDAIADAFNPVLLLVCLLLPGLPAVRHSMQLSTWYTMTIGSLVVVYGVAGLESYLGIWKAMRADFSTHCAFTIAIALVTRYAGSKIFAVVGASAVAYMLLVLYQKYHSALDVLSTCVVVGGLVTLVHVGIRKRPIGRFKSAARGNV